MSQSVTETPAPDHPWEASFVANMTRARLAQGLSQTGLAKRLSARGLGFHPQTVQRIEAGERSIRLNEAVLIVEVLGMAPAGSLGVDAAVFANETQAREGLSQAVQRGRRLWRDIGTRDEQERAQTEEVLRVLWSSLAHYRETTIGLGIDPDPDLVDRCNAIASQLFKHLESRRAQAGGTDVEHPEET